MEIMNRINDIDGLREMYREPSAVAANKVFDTIDESSAAFVDRCPFVVISTTDGAGSIDTSPRGGPPGFVQRLDDRHVAIPDLNGNNRLDSLENIVKHPYVGLLLVMPGKDETLRIKGPAMLTTDSSVLDSFTTELRRPKLAIVVEVAELYVHCAKAFRRGEVWNVESWVGHAATPDLAEIASTQLGLEGDRMRTTLEKSYQHDLTLD